MRGVGVGDHILAHRFSVAIKEKYPNSELHAFSDTEDNFLQKTVLEHLYPGFYSSITVIPHKKYKKCIINSQFGSEEYRGGLQNVSDDILEKMTKDCEKFFNLHIDSLSFLDFKDINWNKYFFTIPEPTINPINKWGDKYICLHLVSGSSLIHRLQQWFIERIIGDISKRFSDYTIYLISAPETNSVYDKVVSLPNVKLFNGEITEVCDLILCSKGIIGVDSALRLLGHSKSLATVTMSKDCLSPGNCPMSHRLRWLLFPGSTFPLNWNTKEILDLFVKMLDSKLYLMFPELASVNTDINNVIVNRNLKVDLEKSIL